MAFDNTYLLNQIKARALIPTSQKTFEDEDILELATDEMHNTVLPMIMGARSEFYVITEDFNVTEAVNYIDIPYRSLGLSVRDVVEVKSDKEYPLSWLEPAYKDRESSAGFFFQGNRIILRGVNTSTVRIYYYLRPGNLVTTNSAAKILSIDTVTGVIGVTAVPSAWSTSDTLDGVKSRPGFDNVAMDRVISNITSPNITLANVSGLSVGDWVALSGESPVPQIPVEFFPYLAQLTAVKILEGIGDFEGMQVAASKLEDLKRNALNLITPRTKGQAKKLTGHIRY